MLGKTIDGKGHIGTGALRHPQEGANQLIVRPQGRGIPHRSFAEVFEARVRWGGHRGVISFQKTVAELVDVVCLVHEEVAGWPIAGDFYGEKVMKVFVCANGEFRAQGFY